MRVGQRIAQSKWSALILTLKLFKRYNNALTDWNRQINWKMKEFTLDFLVFLNTTLLTMLTWENVGRPSGCRRFWLIIGAVVLRHRPLCRPCRRHNVPLPHPVAAVGREQQTLDLTPDRRWWWLWQFGKTWRLAYVSRVKCKHCLDSLHLPYPIIWQVQMFTFDKCNSLSRVSHVQCVRQTTAAHKFYLFILCKSCVQLKWDEA